MEEYISLAYRRKHLSERASAVLRDMGRHIEHVQTSVVQQWEDAASRAPHGAEVLIRAPVNDEAAVFLRRIQGSKPGSVTPNRVTEFVSRATDPGVQETLIRLAQDVEETHQKVQTEHIRKLELEKRRQKKKQSSLALASERARQESYKRARAEDMKNAREYKRRVQRTAEKLAEQDSAVFVHQDQE